MTCLRRLGHAAWRSLRAAACVTTTAGVAAAAQAASAAARPEPGAEFTIGVITVGQGDQVWERFGHNALWVHDAARGTDVAYNWGLFDFADADFMLRFLRGEMRYRMEGEDAVRMLEIYRSFDRTITMQRLALTPAQRRALVDFLEWNVRPENKYYRYDYYLDNCSTRVRDAIDRVLGGALRAATVGQRTSNTYRSESVRLMEGMPLTQAGIMAGLGPRTDRPLNGWEEMFVPMRMRDRLRQVRVPGPGGTMIPLVAEERPIFVAARAPEATGPPPLGLRYALVGLLLGAVFAALGWRASAVDHRAARAGLAVAGGLWGLTIGVLGVVLTLLWVATQHVFAHRNENLFQINPLSLGLAVLIPAAVYRPGLRRAARRLAAVVLALSLAGLALKILPAFHQRNLPIVALLLPAQAALAWALVGLGAAEGARAAAAGSRVEVGSRDAVARRASAP